MSAAALSLIIALLPYAFQLGEDGIEFIVSLIRSGAAGQDPTAQQQQLANSILLSIHGEQSVVDQMVARATADAEAKISAATKTT